jgi:hypothetical protein
MFAANLVKYLSRWVSASVGYVIQALTDAFLGIGLGSNIEQSLIGFGVLHDGRCFPPHGEHHGALVPSELFHEIAGPATEGGQRLDVLGNVKHGPAPIKAPF